MYACQHYKNRDVLDTQHELQELDVVDESAADAGSGVRPDAEAATTGREEANSDQTPLGARAGQPLSEAECASL